MFYGNFPAKRGRRKKRDSDLIYPENSASYIYISKQMSIYSVLDSQ